MNQLNKNKTLTKIKKAILSPDFRNFKRRNQLSKSNLELRYPNFKTLSSDFPNFKRRNLAVLLSPGQKSPFLSSRSGCPQNCFWRRKKILQFLTFSFSCVTFSSAENTTQCEDCVSGCGSTCFPHYHVFMDEFSVRNYIVCLSWGYVF